MADRAVAERAMHGQAVGPVQGHDPARVDWSLLQADQGALFRESADDGRIAPQTVLGLQALAGNQAVSRLVAEPAARRRTTRRRRHLTDESTAGTPTTGRSATSGASMGALAAAGVQVPAAAPSPAPAASAAAPARRRRRSRRSAAANLLGAIAATPFGAIAGAVGAAAQAGVAAVIGVAAAIGGGAPTTRTRRTKATGAKRPAKPAGSAKGRRPTGVRPRPAPRKRAVEGAQEGAEGGAGEAAPAKLPPAPIKRPPIPPRADPRFRAVTGRVGATSTRLRTHDPAEQKVAEASGAAVAPENDVHSQAAAAQVGDMAAAPTPGFDKVAFIAAVKEAVSHHAPSSLSEAMDYDESGKAKLVKGEVQGVVGQNKAKSKQQVEVATKAAPDPKRGIPKLVTPLPPENPAAAPASVAAQAGMPLPQPPGATNFSRGPAEINQDMAAADVTEGQIRDSNEPDFNAALDTKKSAEEHSRTAPAKYRAAERDIVGGTRAGAATTANTLVAGMHAKQVGTTQGVGAGKGDAKAKEEAKRAEIATALDQIYQAAQTDVTAILDGIDPKVESAFDQGEQAAREKFEHYVTEQTRAYKKRRYKGLRGKARWVRDKFKGLPDDVNKFYEDGKAHYIADMDGVIGRVADIVGTDLTAAHSRIAKGLTDVTEFVKKQPKDLQQIAAEAQQNIQEKFTELTDEVTSKQDALVKTIADKYVAGRDAIDARITELQEENKGWIDKAKDAIKGVINAIRKLKDLILNVLSRVAGAIGSIIAHPIRFLGNLVDAVGAGISKFRDNIAKHLENALAKWLFGHLADAGIELPDSFDLKGVLSIVLQLLGVSYSKIRARVVTKIGEPATQKAEQTLDIFKTLASEGPAGLWRFIEGRLGELKDKAWTMLKDWVEEKVVIAGITWLLGLLTPVGAFIKACKAIYDIIKFFIDKGSEIIEVVNTILDSIEAIIAGGVGAVADKIEKSLAGILSLAISFLASLLGLGGVGKKVREVFDAISKPIGRIVDGVINVAIKPLKWIGRKTSRARAWATHKVESGKAAIGGRIDAGKAWVRGALATPASKADGAGASAAKSTTDPDAPIVVPVSMAGSSHRLISQGDSVQMASTQAPIETRLNQALASARAQHEAIEEARMEIAELVRTNRSKARQEELAQFIETVEQQHARSGMSQSEELDQIAQLAEHVEALGRRRRASDRPAIERAMRYLGGALESYATRYNLHDLGPMSPGVSKGRGAILSYHAASSGREELNLEAEHIAPGSILQLLARRMSGRELYTRPKRGERRTGTTSYERNTTILVDKAIADIKTDEGVRGFDPDQAVIRDIKQRYARAAAAVRAGRNPAPGDVAQLNDFVLDRLEFTKRARDLFIGRVVRGAVAPPTGYTRAEYLTSLRGVLTDGNIHTAAMAQMQEVWEMAKAAQRRR